MSERLPPAEKRQEFTAAVRKAALARANGHCEGCGATLIKGRYTFDHTVPWRRGGPSTLDNCKVLCRTGKNSCDWIKTHLEDLPGIAAVKRYAKNRLPLDIGRPEKKPGMIQGRGFGQQHRPLKSRNTFERRK